MSRDRGKLDEILRAIVQRLIDEVEECELATCYLGDERPSPGPGGFLYAVSISDGQFDDSMFDGGGQEQCTAQCDIVVRIFSPLLLDEPERTVEFLTNQAQGVIQRASLVLAALAGWSPVSSGNELTRDPLIPASFASRRAPKTPGSFEVGLRCTFDWDLR